MNRKSKSHQQHSSFWLGETNSINNGSLIQLAACRRAVGNFVMIMTGKNIPVRFAERSTSFTDGNIVQIGGELADGFFDETVGLALHEGSHIVKSNFDLLKNLWQTIPNKVYDAIDGKLPKSYIAEFTKEILNIVEDRYIDAWVYKNAPGYRGYYDALYNRYFNVAKITKALLSNEFREPTIKNYRFRILNMINSAAPKDALPGLEKIVEKIDLKNILRLETAQDRVELAYDVVEMIFREVVDALESEKNNNSQNDNCSENNDASFSGGNSSDSAAADANGENDTTDDQEDGDDDENELKDLLGGETGASDHYVEKTDVEKILGDDIEEKIENAKDDSDSKSQLTPREMKALETAMQTQIDFTNRELSKKSFTKDMLKKLMVLEKSGIELSKVGDDKNITCVYVKKMTKELMADRENFPYNSHYSSHEESVKEGIRFGTMLGRRLQIRNDTKNTIYNRLESGKISKRMLNELGFNNENVFYRVATEKFKNTHLHISVDASSSMDMVWGKTLKTLVAIAKAGSMVKNLEVSITLRSATTGAGETEVVYIVNAYDSRVDKFSKIVQLFPKLSPHGCTPEGLAFEEIVKNIPIATNEKDVFFVNLSDGEPYMATHAYYGEPAWRHTQKQVEKMRQQGVEVISYYINNESERLSDSSAAFKIMYGRDSNIIDTNNIHQVAYTLNKKFAQK